MAGFSLSLPLCVVSDDTEFLSGVRGWAVITGVIGGWTRTVGTQAPVDDFGLVENKALEHVVAVGRCQTRRVTHSAVDVGDHAARSTHDVMVVVADPGLVTGNHAQGLDPTHKANGGECVENVVDGLAGDVGKTGADGRQDRLGIGMRMGVNRF
jgi:hypothetical protein